MTWRALIRAAVRVAACPPGQPAFTRAELVAALHCTPGDSTRLLDDLFGARS